MFGLFSKATSTPDPFRPHEAVAGAIYDAFQAEARQRAGRPLDVWIAAERQAVQTAAARLATQHGLRTPTLAEIEAIEQLSTGADFGSKLALRVAEAMRRPR